MPPQHRRPSLFTVLLAVCRMLGWLNDLIAIVVMAYVVRCWPDTAAAISAGLIGSSFALLNDSWEMIAQVDSTGSFSPLSPPRAVLHDLFSLAICMGGLMLLLFADIREEKVAEVYGTYEEGWDNKRMYINSAQWFLAAVAVWRFIFAIWSGCSCTRQRRSRDRHGRRRRVVPETQDVARA